MLNPSEKEEIKKGMIIPWIIWTAMLITLFIYVLVCKLAGSQIRQNANSDLPINLIRNILYVVAGITLFASYFIRKLALSGRLSSTRQIASNISQFSTQPKAIGQYLAAMIISLALSESIGIYGLVLFFIGDSFQTLYTFIGVAAIAMIYYRPKMEEVINLADDMRKRMSQTPKT